ncbi:hypothetical protein D3C78_1602210 [compost metagenome]
MIPLPVQRQLVLCIIEIITNDQRLVSGRGQRNFKCLGGLPVHTDNRPSVYPGNGQHAGNPAYCIMILKQHGIPLAFRRVNDASLRNAFVVVAHVVIENQFAFIRPQKLLRTITNLSSALVSGPWPLDE